jgi:hypothetical protein
MGGAITTTLLAKSLSLWPRLSGLTAIAV